jgi:ubiquinone/menaquinone biosynthesis C-methylase UbiE
MKKETSWGSVSEWYNDLLNTSSDSYQKNVILPNLLRLVDPKKNLTILDLACGQGYFSHAFAKKGAEVIGSDISKELIELANKVNDGNKSPNKPKFYISPADNISFIKDSSIDTVTIVLALQNIENLADTIKECSRVLKNGGKLFIVLNHPAFRIPENSSWQWDEINNKQYRRIDSYMSDRSTKIDMTPGENDVYKKKFTVTFHRPLQSYFKALNKSGLNVLRLEEWISHKKASLDHVVPKKIVCAKRFQCSCVWSVGSN